MKHQIEIFTAGCPFCEPVVELVTTTACGSCEVTTHNLAGAVAGSDALRKARAYGVQAAGRRGRWNAARLLPAYGPHQRNSPPGRRRPGGVTVVQGLACPLSFRLLPNR